MNQFSFIIKAKMTKILNIGCDGVRPTKSKQKWFFNTKNALRET